MIKINFQGVVLENGGKYSNIKFVSVCVVRGKKNIPRK